MGNVLGASSKTPHAAVLSKGNMPQAVARQRHTQVGGTHVSLPPSKMRRPPHTWQKWTRHCGAGSTDTP
eukprot:364493-Chlamydomonas_euryale.AAC.16